MNTLMQVFVAASKKWWVVVLVIVANFASFAILFSLEDQFEAITATPVYDTQNDLTPDLIRGQFPLYVGEGRNAYLRFAAFDFVFPLVAAIFVTLLWTLLLRLNQWHIAQRLLHWKFPLIAFTVTLWDWLENVNFLALLNSGAIPNPTLIEAALLFKKLKLLSLAGISVLTWALILMMLVNVGYRLLNNRSNKRLLSTEG